MPMNRSAAVRWLLVDEKQYLLYNSYNKNTKDGEV